MEKAPTQKLSLVKRFWIAAKFKSKDCRPFEQIQGLGYCL